MSNVLKISKTTIHRCLKKMGMVSKLNVWVPHELTERNRLKQTTACMSLLARNKHEPFLKRLVTGDKKWILYENPKRKRSWSQRNQPPQRCAKSGLHPRKVLLCVWWDYKGILYFELYLVVIPLIHTNITLS